MSERVVLGGILVDGCTLQLLDQPTGMDAALSPEFVSLRVTGGHVDLTLAQLRRFKETLLHAERILSVRSEKAALSRNLPLPL